jgi:hypothetical protein
MAALVYICIIQLLVLGCASGALEFAKWELSVSSALPGRTSNSHAAAATCCRLVTLSLMMTGHMRR